MKKLYAILALAIVGLIVIPLTAFADNDFDLYAYHYDLNPGYSAKGDKNVNANEGAQQLQLSVSSSNGLNPSVSYVSLTANKKMLFGIMTKQAEVKIDHPHAGDKKSPTYYLSKGEYEYVTKAYGDYVKGSVNVTYNYWSD